jgi:hypothetical protein
VQFIYFCFISTMSYFFYQLHAYIRYEGAVALVIPRSCKNTETGLGQCGLATPWRSMSLTKNSPCKKPMQSCTANPSTVLSSTPMKIY